MRNLNIDKELFNPLFFKIWDFFDSNKRFASVYGGASSSKSYSLTQAYVLKLLQSKKRLLVLRQTSSSLNGSCIELFKDVLESWGIPYKLNKTEKVITFQNGSTILFKGLDNVEKLKSIASLSAGIWIEEATELDSANVFAQINARVRGVGCEKAKIIVTFNPVSKSNWVYGEFHKEERDDVEVLHSTYKDNKFIDSESSKQLERYKKTNKLFYEIYCLGLFGFIASGQEIFSNFLLSKHVSNEVCYDPSKPLVLSFDENVVPHVTLLVGQKHEGEMHYFDEICIKGLKETCDEFNKKYSDHKELIFITGDATSRKEDAKLEKGFNFYTLVLNYFRKQFSSKQLKLVVPKTNESVFLRSNYINELLEEDDSIKVRIHPRLTKLIEDLECCVWSADGKGVDKMKKTITDPYSGKKSAQEMRGHLVDTFAYSMLYVYQHEYQTHKRGGSGQLARKFNNSQKQKNYRNSNY